MARSSLLFVGTVFSFASLVFAPHAWSASAEVAVAAAAATADGEKSLAAMKGVELYRADLEVLAQTSEPEVRSQYETLAGASVACESWTDRARRVCLENLSPMAQSAIGYLGMGMPLIKAVAGTQDKCSEAFDIFGMAEKAMAAYNVACSAGKGTCVMKCSSSIAAAEKAEKTCSAKLATVKKKIPTLEALVQDPSNPNFTQYRTELTEAKYEAQELEKCVKIAISGKAVFAAANTSCNDFQKNVGAGIAALASIVTQKKAAAQCKKDSQAKAGGNMQADATMDCNKPENTANPRCICERNPRSTGCPGASLASGGATDPVRSTTGAREATGMPTSLGSLADSGPETKDPKEKEGNSAGAIAGGGSSGGSSLSGSNGASASDSKPGARLNANVLAGEYGGGGGGRGFGGSRGGGGGMGAYSAYLPKAQDQRNLASVPTGITSGTGQGNWEKVRTRYRELRPSLLNK